MSLIETLREATQPRRNTGKGITNSDTPCWRVNKAIEERALEKAFSRHKCTTDEQKQQLVSKMVLEIQAQTRYRKQLKQTKGEFVPQPRQLSVWLNSDGWCDEFEVSTSELKTDTAQKACHVPGCPNPGTIPHTWTLRVCEAHYESGNPYLPEMREWYGRNRIERGNMTPQEYHHAVLAKHPETAGIAKLIGRQI